MFRLLQAELRITETVPTLVTNKGEPDWMYNMHVGIRTVHQKTRKLVPGSAFQNTPKWLRRPAVLNLPQLGPVPGFSNGAATRTAGAARESGAGTGSNPESCRVISPGAG